MSGLSSSVSTAMFVGSVIMGVVTMLIWKNKEGSSVIGFILGFLLGLIGLVVVLVAHPAAVKKREKETRERMLQQMTMKTGAFEPSPLANPQAAARYQVAVTSPPPLVIPMRVCPHCGHQFQSDVTTCPRCGRNSEPWSHHEGYWFTKNPAGQEFWLEPVRHTWLLYRRTENCPSCQRLMPANAAICPQCEAESNAFP